MKFISITKSINIRPDWASIGARLKAGTPLAITGAVANSSAAVGILADDAEKSSAEVAVVTEGSIDLAEVAASYGELTDDCIAAIKGISFIGSDGNPIVPSGGGLPDYSEASDGDVLSIDNGAPAWVTPSGGGAWDKWNEQMKEVTFVDFEATSEHTIDVFITCSDGYASSSWECDYDPEIGEYRYYWDEWTSDEDIPAIPNLENYISTLEWNIGLILKAAFAEAHDWSQAQNTPMPAIVCRSWKNVWE